MAFKTISSDSNIPSTSNTSSSLCDALWSIDYSTKDSLTAATTTTPAEKGTKVVGDEIVPYENRIISPTLLSIAAQHPIYVAGTLNVTSKLTYLLRFPTMTLSSSDTPHLPPILSHTPVHSLCQFTFHLPPILSHTGIAVGSSTQICLCVMPLLIIIAWGMDRPLTMNFEPFEAFTLFTSVFILSICISHGQVRSVAITSS